VEELSSRAGISAQSLNNIEIGRNLPKLTTLVSIAGALGSSVDELLGLELTSDESEIRDLQAFKKRYEIFSELPKKVQSILITLAEELLEK
jgi:transcriptional regulator with XRE-family HTH domain